MLARMFVALLGALFLALPITVGLAVSNPDPVGRAQFGGSGTAFLQRRLTSNQSHVTLRMTGLTPGAQVTYEIRSGSTCGVTPGTAVLTSPAPVTVSSLGQVMVATTLTGTVPVNAPGTPQAQIAMHVFETVGGKTRPVTCAG